MKRRLKGDQSKKERTRIAQEREKEVEKEEKEKEEKEEKEDCSLVTWYSIWHSVLSCRGRLGREVRIVL